MQSISELTRPPCGATLVTALLTDRSPDLLATIDMDEVLSQVGKEGGVSRVGFAAALNVILFDRLLQRAPTGMAFVADQRARGERIEFDHGAIRSVLFPTGDTGELPGGQAAISRILAPLGYRVADTYPLPRLRMTGRAWTQQDEPERLPQFFVSELHVDQFDADFADVAHRVFGASRDPLTDASVAALEQFEREGAISLEIAIDILPNIVDAFDRHHPLPSLPDYQALLSQSAEAAWIATEGNAFNHATSRVADVIAEAERQRHRGLPIKDQVEVSRNGRVRQTAFRADPVDRHFGEGENAVSQSVPGSFYEIISRDVDPATGKIDLSFDSGNATGIFAMTRAA